VSSYPQPKGCTLSSNTRACAPSLGPCVQRPLLSSDTRDYVSRTIISLHRAACRSSDSVFTAKPRAQRDAANRRESAQDPPSRSVHGFSLGCRPRGNTRICAQIAVEVDPRRRRLNPARSGGRPEQAEEGGEEDKRQVHSDARSQRPCENMRRA